MKLGMFISITPKSISPKIKSKEPMKRTKTGEVMLPKTFPPRAQITPIILIVKAKPSEKESI